MKKSLLIAGLGSLTFGLVLTGNVVGATIQDNYIGGIQFGNNVYDSIDGQLIHDILGDDDRYGLDSITVTFSNSTTKIDIYGAYFQHVTSNTNDFIDLGDLFLSTNGWNPVNPTTKDTYQFGEFWEFALVLDDHTGNTPAGTATLYKIDGIAEYILAEKATTSPTKRYGQESLLNIEGKANDIVGNGSWSLFTDHLSFTIDTSLLNLGRDDLGLRWTMTCANDIIEGSVSPVPEPATILLFGFGMASLVGLRTRRKA